MISVRNKVWSGKVWNTIDANISVDTRVIVRESVYGGDVDSMRNMWAIAREINLRIADEKRQA